MISDEEITTKATVCGGEFHPTEEAVYGFYYVEDLQEFARTIYNLGRQHQRESDAALCDEGIAIDGGRSNGKVFTYPRLAEAIRNNTGELK